jgi:hypothetical protein
MRSIQLLFALTSTLVACGGADPADEPPLQADMCAAICDNEKQCDGTTTCEPCGVDQDRIRPEARASIAECYEELTMTCTGSDDACFVNAARTRDIDDQFAQLCFEMIDACGGSDDLCALSHIFEEQYVEAALECLDAGCEDATACIEDAFGIE